MSCEGARNAAMGGLCQCCPPATAGVVPRHCRVQASKAPERWPDGHYGQSARPKKCQNPRVWRLPILPSSDSRFSAELGSAGWRRHAQRTPRRPWCGPVGLTAHGGPGDTRGEFTETTAPPAGVHAPAPCGVSRPPVYAVSGVESRDAIVDDRRR